MRPRSLIAAVTLAVLGLAACSKSGGGAGSGICTPFAEANAAAPAAGDPAAALDDCLHRWGYTLATAPDRAEEVAQAAVAACMPALTQWNQQALSAQAPGSRRTAPAEPAPSLLTGQPTTPIAEHYNYAQARALLYVVQGRAGKCAPPPATSPKSTP